MSAYRVMVDMRDKVERIKNDIKDLERRIKFLEDSKVELAVRLERLKGELNVEEAGEEQKAL
jgi:predicted RNase H-like nuclease (RuvC/YqgF family)